MDFHDLNKSCSKDCYPLPHINEIVDSTTKHEFISMMGIRQGYYQTPLTKVAQAKVRFITTDETFCDVVMLFGLKNMGAIYQRLMDKMFMAQAW